MSFLLYGMLGFFKKRTVLTAQYEGEINVIATDATAINAAKDEGSLPKTVADWIDSKKNVLLKTSTY